MFTNGESPMRHSISDRRCNYYRLEYKLEHTLAKFDMEPDEFFDKVEEEVMQFWAILIKTKLKKSWQNGNFKNGQYHKQLFLMHPFGKFILKVINGDWEDIAVQLNEKIKDEHEVQNNLTLLEEIRNAFFTGEGIQLTLINRYLDAMNWRSTINIQDFIVKNSLQEHGLKIMLSKNSVAIGVDAEKIQKFIFQENNLAELVPEYASQPIKTLEELIEQAADKAAVTASGSSGHRAAPPTGISPNVGTAPVGNMPGLAPGVPSGAPAMPNMPGVGSAPGMPAMPSGPSGPNGPSGPGLYDVTKTK